jgi:hypothetical protein
MGTLDKITRFKKSVCLMAPNKHYPFISPLQARFYNDISFLRFELHRPLSTGDPDKLYLIVYESELYFFFLVPHLRSFFR